MVRLSKNSNVVHECHSSIVKVVLVNDVASLDVNLNGVDSSSNWSMVVMVVLMSYALMDHKRFHDGKVHDDVDNEMY